MFDGVCLRGMLGFRFDWLVVGVGAFDSRFVCCVFTGVGFIGLGFMS